MTVGILQTCCNQGVSVIKEEGNLRTLQPKVKKTYRWYKSALVDYRKLDNPFLDEGETEDTHAIKPSYKSF
jgi:hypothetical protein